MARSLRRWLRRSRANLVEPARSGNESSSPPPRQRRRSGSTEFLAAEIRNAFDPNSRFIQVWQQLVLLAIMYETLVLPFLAAFHSSESADTTKWALMALYFCEVFFCLDVYVQLNTGYYEDGNVLRDARKSRIKYLKSWAFALDVVVLPPWSLLPMALPVHELFFEFHKVIRLWRVPKLIADLDDVYARYFVVLKLAKVLATTLVVSHFVACGRFVFGYDQHHGDSWLPAAPDKEYSLQRKYLMSMFWGFGLLTGFVEGELPQTSIEFVFTIFAALCGFSLFTYLCATFFMLSKCEGGVTETSEARVNQFKHLLAFHRVPEQLQRQAVEYLKKYYTQAESNDREATKLLCPSITVDIQIELLRDTVALIPVFHGCDTRFLNAVTSLLEMVSYPAQFVLFRAGDVGDAMYVVNSGVLHTVVDGLKVRELRKGSFFGEVAVFAQMPRSATMITTTYCTLYRLAAFHAEKLMEGYPRYADLIRLSVSKILMTTNERKEDRISEIAATEAAASRKKSRTHFMNTTLARSLTGKKRTRVKPQIHRDSRNTQTIANTPQAGVGPRPALQKTAAARSVSCDTPSSLDSPPQNTDTPSRMAPFANAVGPIIKEKSSRKVFPSTETQQSEASSGHGPTVELRRTSSHLSLFKNGLLRLSKNFGRDTGSHDAIQGFYDQIQQLAVPNPYNRWWSKFLLSKCIDTETPFRMTWLLVLQLNLCYNWIFIPLQLSFPLFDRNVWYMKMADHGADFVLWVDIYLNCNFAFSINSEKIFNTSRSAQRYVKSGCFFADLVCSLPYEFVSPFSGISRVVLRLPRLFRVWRLRGHFSEVEEFFVINSRQRLVFFGLLLLMLYHVVACMYFSVTALEGFSPSDESWLPSDDIFLEQVNHSFYIDIRGVYHDVTHGISTRIGARQYFRSLYYAANVLTGLGRTVEPTSDVQYKVALVFMLSGFLITAVVVDEVQKRFTSSAFEQKEFFANRARIQLFLKRQNAPWLIHQRVNSFLDYWWSSHRGAIIGELLEELPETIKRDIVRSICKPAMESLALIRPEVKGGEQGGSADTTILQQHQLMEDLFLDNLRFILYGQGEIIYRQGDYPSGLYFLVEGQIVLQCAGLSRSVPLGGFFGTAALNSDHDFDGSLAQSNTGYAEHVLATSGCIVVYIAKDHLIAMEKILPSLPAALRWLERRLFAARINRSSEIGGTQQSNINYSQHDIKVEVQPRMEMFRVIKSTRCWRYINGDLCFDPDLRLMGVWEITVFVLMSTQCCRVIFYSVFGVGRMYIGSNVVQQDITTALIEMLFLFDVFIRLRLGFYKFGNKVMELGQIKTHYLGSKYFLIDILALIPLFCVNWALPDGFHRIEILNLNKLLRLFKVSHQLRAIESRYVKLTLEIRLFRLVYYTFLASHLFGCIRFDFAANNSGLHSAADASFGRTKWLPYSSLENATPSLQYFSSVFWSFGLMSASSTGELPKTVPQCLFSIFTMTVGFFLFAYVVGNFLDVIELHNSEDRHFIAKLSSLRHLLAHFKLPSHIEAKFKTYFFFKRFHSITQEHVLERVLPPSLLIDIRMFQLQSMIVKVAFLAGMEDSVTRMLVSLFTQMLVVKDEYICKFGEEGSEMYFIFTGMLDIYIPVPGMAGSVTMKSEGSVLGNKRQDDMAGMQKVNEITAGNYFGEAALFTNAPRNANVKARTSCILYRLSRQSLELVFERFPEWKQKVLRIVKIQQEQQRLARLAIEAQKTNETPKRRSLHRAMSRMDVINSRAEDLEAMILVNSWGERWGSFAPITWFLKSTALGRFIDDWMQPISTRMRQYLELLIVGTEIQSPFYVRWLQLVTACTMFTALITPYRCAYDDLERWNVIPFSLRLLEDMCQVVFYLDIWFHFHVKESHMAMELYEQAHKHTYKREHLVWDVVAAFPLDHFTMTQLISSRHATIGKWMRLNKCVKVCNVAYYRSEIHRRSVSYEFNRLVTLWLLYLLVIYWTSCAYFAVAMYTGFGQEWQAWLPSVTLEATERMDILLLRLFRGFSFATTAFVKKGRTFVPTETLDYAFSIAISFFGQLVMALMIGEVASLFILSIDNEVEYRKNHIAVEHYLSRKRITSNLKLRTGEFLTSWWSSHAGVNYQLVFDDLPVTVRTEGILDIVAKPLYHFTELIFRPLTRGAESDEAGDIAVEQLMHSIAQNLRFEGYPRGESVVVEGTVCKAMYFVVRGHLYSKSVSNPGLYHMSRYRTGDFFGEKALLGHAVSMFSVTTTRACDLFVLSSENLLGALQSHSYFSLILKMARDIAHQQITLADYFADAATTDKRDVLRRRLSAPIFSQASTPTTTRSAAGQRYCGLADDQLNQLLRLSNEAEWEEGFTRFMGLIVVKGSMEDIGSKTVGANGVINEGEQKVTNKASGFSARIKRARSQVVPNFRAQGVAGDLNDLRGTNIIAISEASGQSMQSDRSTFSIGGKTDQSNLEMPNDVWEHVANPRLAVTSVTRAKAFTTQVFADHVDAGPAHALPVLQETNPLTPAATLLPAKVKQFSVLPTIVRGELETALEECKAEETDGDGMDTLDYQRGVEE